MKEESVTHYNMVCFIVRGRSIPVSEKEDHESPSSVMVLPGVPGRTVTGRRDKRKQRMSRRRPNDPKLTGGKKRGCVVSISKG